MSVRIVSPSNGSMPSIGLSSPRTRKAGALPTVMCKSEAPRATVCSSRESIEWITASTNPVSARPRRDLNITHAG